jgi:hypothetical protein
MRKIFSWPALLLLPAICLLSSCASYNVPPTAGADRHEFLYVEAGPSIPSGDPSLYGYSVAEDGRLTRLAGYPHPGILDGVISGKYLFRGDPDGVHLDTYLIGADGSITKIQSVLDQATAQCGSECWVGPDLTDRTGSSLYVTVDYYNSGDDIQRPETYSIDKSTGELTYLSQGGAVWSGGHEGCDLEFFSSSDLYGYGLCSSAYYPAQIDIMARGPDGSLTHAPNANVIGPTPPGGIIYGETAAGTDTTNHLAAVLYSDDENRNQLRNLPFLLASYTINADGSLTSTNTTADMPAIQQISAIGGLSPSGKLFAVGEPNGIQIFNFNGAAPMTPNGALIPTEEPVIMQWDDQNHLFVLSSGYNKVYVFTVTDSGMVQAPGSPHTIDNAAFLSVASI